jgi:hypothetical protein
MLRRVAPGWCMGLPPWYEVGVPDEHIAGLGMKFFALEMVLRQYFLDFILVAAIALGADGPARIARWVVLAGDVRQAVAAGVKKQRTVVGAGGFQRRPGGYEIALRLGAHVDGIGVGALLAAFHEVDGVEGLYFAAHDEAEELQQIGLAEKLLIGYFAVPVRLHDFAAGVIEINAFFAQQLLHIGIEPGHSIGSKKAFEDHVAFVHKAEQLLLPGQRELMELRVFDEAVFSARLVEPGNVRAVLFEIFAADGTEDALFQAVSAVNNAVLQQVSGVEDVVQDIGRLPTAQCAGVVPEPMWEDAHRCGCVGGRIW